MRQTYPILLWTAIALAVGVYLHPKEARQCLQLAHQWGAAVATDVLRAASAFADERRAVEMPGGSAPASPYAAALPAPEVVTAPRILAGPGQDSRDPAYSAAPPPVDTAAALRADPIRDAYPQQQTSNPLRPTMPRVAPWTAEQAAPPLAVANPPAIAQPVGQPIAQPVAQPVGQPVAQPVGQPVAWPVGQPPHYGPGDPHVASAPPRQEMPEARGQTQAAGHPEPLPGAELEGPDPVADLTLCEGAQVLARVGSEVVLGSEVLPKINEKLSTVKGLDKIPADQLERQRELLVRQLLQSQIDLKLIYVDAKRTLPPEAIENISKHLSNRFAEVEVANRMKELKLASRRELEAQLGQWGTSLEREKRAFIEKAIAQQWVVEMLRKEEEQIRHDELLAYYQEHAEDYEHPARVRWEHLAVKFSRHPDKREAWQLIAAMGNEVMQGRPFADVARQRSEGATAMRGGQRDWITRGSLKSALLDQALFTLPPGQLSRILQDEEGFHIVRVIEREDAHRTPFEETQAEIREKMLAERKEARLKELVQRLREEIPVWTIFDGKTADARGNGVRNQF
ncbi:MAG: peptidyl-prolyl cis-trans isomerase [Pirellulales bacterium]|jgi:hypothetical protein|nr:peptidyl-prolyl cis-trans isomerase [Thermoguttaceae bacterium]MDD4785827.1 peptidyl-prolyl cis-trans isomerase [Pirellulales bacterium]MDI9446066.1 peptidyl-prolyl cis-trans isomerase [Planctomycetota bacterium]